MKRKTPLPQTLRKASTPVKALPKIVPGTWQQIDRCYGERLFNNFHQTVRKPFEAQHPGIPIPSNFWFEGNFINHLAQRIKDNDYSGIRIYFGAYDPGMGQRTNTPYASSPTIFIVETKSEGGVHVDQFSGICVETAFYDGYNHGHLCPPDPADQCSGAAFDTRRVP